MKRIAELEQKLTRTETDRDILVSSINLLTPAMQSRIPTDTTLARFVLEHDHYKQNLTDLRTAAKEELARQCVGCMKELQLDEFKAYHFKDERVRPYPCTARKSFRAAIERSRQ